MIAVKDFEYYSTKGLLLLAASHSHFLSLLFCIRGECGIILKMKERRDGEYSYRCRTAVLCYSQHTHTHNNN